MKKPITVSIDTVNHAASVSGFHARRLIIAAGGRPFWSRQRSVWMTSQKTAIEVVAMAESENIPVHLGGEVVER